VYLVGAGPGDPGLLTARASELIEAADVILYDRLIPPEALAGARADAEVRYVGKEGGGASVDQAEIARLLLEHARAGRLVVRLKGGDPFVFGRGGEEALALRAAGIDFEVVPGVTAGVAAAAYAGIPVTHRGLASAVAFVTAHEDPAKDETIDWGALAAFPGTLVFYMGVRQLPRVTQRLIAGGRNPDEPAAVIEHGTYPDQRTVLATAQDVRAPALTVSGAVAGLAEDLAWLRAAPLAGRTVAITRARAQASGLASQLRALGARVSELPAIRIVPRPLVVPELGDFDLLCLTSTNGVQLLFERLAEQGRDARALAGPRIAAIGAGTAAALAAHGILADVVPDRFVAEGLLEALAGGPPVRRCILARAASARDTLVAGLRARGAEVEVLTLYDTVAEPLDEAGATALAGADYVTFTSSSTVRFLLEQARPSPRARLVSIGPVTSAALRAEGLEPHVEATRHDIPGLLDALLADAVTRT
jgi:uroporphyrinogen III methyltransferase/synthase